MSKKDKKRKKEKIKKYPGKSTANVDERLKSISNIKMPDENPFLIENDKNVDRFWRFGRVKLGKAAKFKNYKQLSRFRHNRGK